MNKNSQYCKQFSNTIMWILKTAHDCKDDIPRRNDKMFLFLKDLIHRTSLDYLHFIYKRESWTTICAYSEQSNTHKSEIIFLATS